MNFKSGNKQRFEISNCGARPLADSAAEFQTEISTTKFQAPTNETMLKHLSCRQLQTPLGLSSASAAERGSYAAVR